MHIIVLVHSENDSQNRLTDSPFGMMREKNDLIKHLFCDPDEITAGKEEGYWFGFRNNFLLSLVFPFLSFTFLSTAWVRTSHDDQVVSENGRIIED